MSENDLIQKIKDFRIQTAEADKKFNSEINKLQQKYKELVLEQAQTLLISNPEIEYVKVILNSLYNDQGGSTVFLSILPYLHKDYEDKVDVGRFTDLSYDLQFGAGGCLFGDGLNLPEQTILYTLRKTVSVQIEESSKK